jgi:hypothetical protein
VLFSSSDFDVITYYRNEPNFIIRRKVEGPILDVNKV